jgi:hypothetical protein
MNPRPLAIITTRLPPQICGVGAYSWQLQQHWPETSRPARFLVIDGANASIQTLGCSAIEEIDNDPQKLLNALKRLGPSDVLLHYAARSYSRFACPFWLPRVLQQWKKTFPNGRLAIFFHEIPGPLPLTSRHFWFALANRRIITKLAGMADAVVTNTEAHARVLRRISKRNDVHVFPVGSNILPNEKATPPMRVPTEFAVFGLPFGRYQTLQLFEREIAAWQNSGVMTRLHLIGPGDARLDLLSREILGRTPQPGMAVYHGALPPSEICSLLLRTQFGLTHATPENWSKSGAFMAYAAQQCTVVGKMKSAAPPLCFTLLPEEVGAVGVNEANERARLLNDWYRRNADWDVIAQKIARLIPLESLQEAIK